MSFNLLINSLRADYIVPALSFLGLSLLYFAVGDISQILAIVIFVVIANIYGIFLRNRWVIAIACLFLYCFLGFELQTVFSGSHSASTISIFLSTFIIYFWYNGEEFSIRNALVGFIVSIAILELFTVLLFWPVNLAVRSILLTMFSFLFFEIIDKSILSNSLARESSRIAPWAKMKKELFFMTIIMIGVVISSEWFMF